MATSSQTLIDASAWARIDINHTGIEARLRTGEIGLTTVTMMEILYSATSAADYDERREELECLPVLPIIEADCRRALDIQALLAHHPGKHHRVKLPDLLVAACAERNRLTILHEDKHFEQIAEVTNQPLLRLTDIS